MFADILNGINESWDTVLFLFSFMVLSFIFLYHVVFKPVNTVVKKIYKESDNTFYDEIDEELDDLEELYEEDELEDLYEDISIEDL